MKHKPLEKHKLELKELANQLSSGDHQKINCPACNSSVSAESININDKIAKCNHCDVIFSFQKEIINLLNVKQIKQEVLRPEGIDVFYFQDDLDITIQQPVSVLEAIAAASLPLFAIIATVVFFDKSNVSILIPAFFWFLSLLSIFNLISIRKHKIHITIDNQRLSIIRRPKKFIKDKSFMVNDIDQIYLKKESTIYSINMIVNNAMGQKHISLITGLDSMSKARYLEQEIERHLGITDRSVPEEIL
jgi:ribosomal protein L37AE/L43A